MQGKISLTVEAVAIQKDRGYCCHGLDQHKLKYPLLHTPEKDSIILINQNANLRVSLKRF